VGEITADMRNYDAGGVSRKGYSLRFLRGGGQNAFLIKELNASHLISKKAASLNFQKRERKKAGRNPWKRTVNNPPTSMRFRGGGKEIR